MDFIKSKIIEPIISTEIDVDKELDDWFITTEDTYLSRYLRFEKDIKTIWKLYRENKINALDNIENDDEVSKEYIRKNILILIPKSTRIRCYGSCIYRGNTIWLRINYKGLKGYIDINNVERSI